jgi:Carboxypeptidase regulatory-like domain/TonB dependent receptor-like, beta-barrel
LAGGKKSARLLSARGCVVVKFWASIRVSILLVLAASIPAITSAQATLGSINGTVSDTTGAVVQKTSVKIRNTATNLIVTTESKDDGSFSAADLPIGNYELTFTKDGFKTVVFPAILVQGNHTATVSATLEAGAVSTSITVESTPLLNQTDTSNGYTLGRDVIQAAPLGTGSFTQLAILAPGTSADFLSGSGTNVGLGNQGIVANGQRDTSNSFTFNSVNANNLFNGNSTSNIADSRFTLNTGEVFGVGGQVQTNTSVFDAIGEGLPTPPPETIQELQVTTSMYDASMGQNAGAHIELTTIAGSNQYHGQAYGYLQNSGLDAEPTFLAQNIIQQVFRNAAPPLHRAVFGGTFGGPIIKDRLFFFASYQRQNVSDALGGAFSGVPTINGLTDSNRDPTDLANLANANDQCPGCITAGQIDSVALAILNAKTKNGQFLIPSDAGLTESSNQLYNSTIRGPASTFKANQVNGNVDYNFSSADRLAAKYYFQRNPTFSPFAISQVAGFPQSLQAGSQVFSLDNTTVVSPNATWEQRFGFIREIASASTSQPFGPSAVGLVLPSGQRFPGINISNVDDGAASEGGPVQPFSGNMLSIGPSTNFANAGIFQNQFEGASKYNWVRGSHTLSFGGAYDYAQLNVENRETNVAEFDFNDLEDFLTGTLGTDHSSGLLLDGETNRHFRSKQVGLFAQDQFKITPHLSVTYGLRWDWDGPLYDANGLMTNFYPKDFGYDLATDTFNPVNGTPGIGIVVAGNNKTLGTKGVSASTLTGRQWGFAPRLGLAWSPLKNFVVRAGVGMYYDRGEYFTELSASAGLGISGPFSVTTQEPFTIPLNPDCGPASSTCSTGCATSAMCLSSTPFGTTLPAPPTSLAAIAALVPNMRQMSACDPTVVPGLQQPNKPYCNVTGFNTALPFLFGGYNPRNKLPYSENWSLDLQWQPRNDLVLTLGYVGNHGVHQPLPIPFNEPGIATPTNPINNQIYSYGYLAAGGPPKGCDRFNDPSPTCFQLPAEEVQTQLASFPASDGNTALRTPFIGISPNADLWTAEGVSSYNALQFGVTKKMSHGLQVNAAYTYSHTLDEGSGLGAGLFFNGNNPANPRTSYANSDFDRPHVFSISYLYDLPTIKDASGIVNILVNGWGVTGVTVAQSGEPFSVIDFSGIAGSLFFSGDDFVINPILPLAPGITPQQAESKAGGGGTKLGFNNMPYVNPNDFSVPLVAPGVDGVPPCFQDPVATGGFLVCDNAETGFGTTKRNVFRAPFETRFDFSIFKNFKINERFNLKYEVDAFNLFNHPSLDSPNTDFELNHCFSPVPCYNLTPNPPNSRGWGVISSTVGSSRFLQMSLHLTF